MRIISPLTFLSLLLCNVVAVLAQSPAIVQADQSFLVGQYMQFAVDSTNSWTVDQALKQAYQPLNKEVLNLGLTPHTAWMQFSVQSQVDEPIFLEIGEPMLETLEVYLLSDSGYARLFDGGFNDRFSQRPIATNRWLFELDIPHGQTQAILIKVNTGYPFKIPVSLATKNTFVAEHGKVNFFWGIYMGLLVFAFFYNLFLAISLRERMYLYYSLYVFLAMSFYIGLQGYNFMLAWPDMPVFNARMPILVCLMNFFVLLFTFRFLGIDRTQKVPFYLGWIFVGLYLLAAALGVVGIYRPSIIIAQALSVFMSLYYIYITIRALVQRIPNARFFALAWLQFIVMTIMFILTDNGVLPANKFTSYSLYIGNGLEVLLLSYALADRINFLKRDNEEKQQEIITQLREKEIIQQKANEELEQKVKERTAEIAEQRNEAVKQRNRSEELLLNILPESTAEEIKRTGTAKAQLMNEVTVMFTDIKDFTKKSESMNPHELVAEVNEMFSAFDRIIEKYQIEKIKTIGDAYMVAGGLPNPQKDHALQVTKAALEMQRYTQEIAQQKKAKGKEFFEIRLGIHSGPVVAGVVGVKKFAYDIWGKTVNMASRMENAGEVNKVNISHSTYDLIKDQFEITARGEVEAKGIGKVPMYYVEGLRAS